MLFSKTLKLLICLVMILPYLVYGSTGQASAASNYNHAELMDYKGYGEAMYESIVEETTFITGQYTDNKEYVSNSIDQIKDYAKFWWEEQKIQGDSVGEKLKDMFVKGAGYTLTVADWVKKFFSDQEEENNRAPDDLYNGYICSYNNGTMVMCNGWGIEFTNTLDGKVYKYFGTITFTPTGTVYTDSLSISATGGTRGTIDSKSFPKDGAPARNFETKSGVLSTALSYGITYKIYNTSTQEIPTINPNPVDKNFSEINNYIQSIPTDQEIVTPEPTPSLTCPGGEKINLTVDGSTFLSSDGKVMSVNKDGTATVNGTSCALEWKTPEMGYVDDKPAMTDKDGNWIDMLTGDILKCVVTGDCKPSVPGEKPGDEVEDLDTGLIEYVKNAYEYATGVLKTATDGLKSLAAGAKDLTALFGVFFSWLPKEMVVLMSSGLGIAIGLRLFRK